MATSDAQTLVDLRTQVKNVDFSSASSTKPAKTGTTLPASCSTGEIFFKTNAAPGSNQYGCTAPNTWTVLGAAAGAAAPANYVVSFAGQTTVNVPGTTHKLGSAYLLVECYDDAAAPAVRVEADQISIDAVTNDVAVMFHSPQTGHCVLSGGSASGASVTPGGDVSGSLNNVTVTAIQGRPVATASPTNGQALVWNSAAAAWQPGAVASSGGASMSAQLGDLNVVRGGATVLTIGAGCAQATPCNVRFGNQVYSITGSSTATISSGSGVAYIYVAHNGVLNVGHSMTLACSAGCQATAGVAAFPPDALPVFTWTATNGAWDTTGGADWRAWLSMKTIISGAGIMTVEAGGQATVAVDTATVPTFLTATALLDFPSIASGACATDKTLNLQGALTGDAVAAGWPSDLTAGLLGSMRVSAANTVAVRLCNLSGASIDPAAATFRGTIVRSF